MNVITVYKNDIDVAKLIKIIWLWKLFRGIKTNSNYICKYVSLLQKIIKHFNYKYMHNIEYETITHISDKLIPK